MWGLSYFNTPKTLEILPSLSLTKLDVNEKSIWIFIIAWLTFNIEITYTTKGEEN